MLGHRVDRVKRKLIELNNLELQARRYTLEREGAINLVIEQKISGS